MKQSDAALFNNDWEYRKAQQEERKKERSKRDQRRGKKDQWQPLPAEAA